MAQVVFIYNQHNIDIQCNKTDKLKDIFNRFYTKTNTSPNTVFFMFLFLSRQRKNGSVHPEIYFFHIISVFPRAVNCFSAVFAFFSMFYKPVTGSPLTFRHFYT